MYQFSWKYWIQNITLQYIMFYCFNINHSIWCFLFEKCCFISLEQEGQHSVFYTSLMHWQTSNISMICGSIYLKLSKSILQPFRLFFNTLVRKLIFKLFYFFLIFFRKIFFCKYIFKKCSWYFAPQGQFEQTDVFWADIM